MPAIIEPPPEDGDDGRPAWTKVAWFAGIAAASAGVTAIVAYALRALLV